MASKNQSAPPADTATQQSLNIFSETLVIERMCDGGYRSIVDEVPEADPEENITVEEMTSEIGKTETEFPVERNHCTITKYSYRKAYRNSSYSARYQYKEFDIQIDREANPNEAQRVEYLIEQLQKLPVLKEQINAIDTYDELMENAALVREYEATYRMMRGIWSKDSILPHALTYTARDFEVEQFPQGFYVVPGVHHSNVKSILDDELTSKRIANYSTAWGGFIVEPENFTAIHDIVEPVYHTAEIEETLDREKLS